MKINTMLLLTLLAGVAEAAEPALPEALTVGWTQGSDALAQMSYCVSDMTQQKLDDIRKRAFNSIIVQYQRTPKSPYLVVQGDRFACFDRNGPGKPILPPKVFAKALRINGASPETADALHRSLAGQMASRGVAEALLKFANGNAIEVTYIVVEEAPAEFFFTTNFVKAGEYDESRYRYVAASPIKSFSAASYGGRRAFAFLQEELAPRPLRGEHLIAKGNGQTAGYAFEGTRWRWSPSTDSTITLAPNGVLDFNPTQGSPAAGTWRVEEQALYFHYGPVYGSAILEGDKLTVAFRTPASGEDSERRWEATLERD